MKLNILAIAFAACGLMAFSCEEAEPDLRVSCFDCTTEGIARAANTDSGCRFLLELSDGKMLHPILPDYVVTNPNQNRSQDPLSSFELKDGQRVLFDYQRVPDQPSPCLDESKVKITCIRETDTKDF